MYTYKDRTKSPNQVPTNDRSNVIKSGKNVTPNKSITPTKTAVKKPNYSNIFKKTNAYWYLKGQF